VNTPLLLSCLGFRTASDKINPLNDNVNCLSALPVFLDAGTDNRSGFGLDALMSAEAAAENDESPQVRAFCCAAGGENNQLTISLA
jgi:hypothetical protein